MRRELATTSAAETAALGRRLGAAAPRGGVAGLWGPLGAGKTVLAQGMLAGMGVPGPHPSPSFVLVRRYPRPGGGWAAHVDAYRLQLAAGDRLEDLGWDELFGEGSLVIVEWAERVVAALPADRLEVRIARGRRAVEAEGPDAGGTPRRREIPGGGGSRADASGDRGDAAGPGDVSGGEGGGDAGDAGARMHEANHSRAKHAAGAEPLTSVAGGPPPSGNAADEARTIELVGCGPTADAWLRAVLP